MAYTRTFFDSTLAIRVSVTFDKTSDGATDRVTALTIEEYGGTCELGIAPEHLSLLAEVGISLPGWPPKKDAPGNGGAVARDASVKVYGNQFTGPVRVPPDDDSLANLYNMYKSARAVGEHLGVPEHVAHRWISAARTRGTIPATGKAGQSKSTEKGKDR